MQNWQIIHLFTLYNASFYKKIFFLNRSSVSIVRNIFYTQNKNVINDIFRQFVILLQRKNDLFIKSRVVFFAQKLLDSFFLICFVFLFSVSGSLFAQTFPSYSQFSAANHNANSSTVSRNPVAPHPAIVRIIAREGNMTSYGSGTLIGKKKNYGFIITNWHVVCDSNGAVTVRFPNRQEYAAVVIAVDGVWDLALLVIHEPKNIEPMPISLRIPNYNEPLWIAGYGSNGVYRVEGGHCTGFKVPERNAPSELIEISVPAERGDSGGPVFNQQKELVGVLFGSDEVQTTMASHCGRVIEFTKQASQNVETLPATPDSLIKIALQSRQTLFQRCAEQVGLQEDAATEYVNITIDPSQYASQSAAASSFGGVRARRHSAATQTQQLVTRRKIFNFLNVHYETTPQNPSTNNSNVVTTTLETTIPVSQVPTQTTVATAKPIVNSINMPNYTDAANDNKIPANNFADGDKVVRNYFKPIQNPVNSSANPVNPTANASYPSYSSLSTAPSTTNTFSESSPVFAASPPNPAFESLSINSAFGNNNASQNNPPQNTPTFNTTNDINSPPDPQPSHYKKPTDFFNAYGQNAPSASQQIKTSVDYLSDNELAAQYALDENEMTSDEHAPKYTEEYGISATAESISTTGSESKFDMLKIVIAILVIFFILFHTIKTMAIAEGQQQK
ncbi:MAG: trypsin-like peptidase domain-containing protein [Planctomycetaceae bacterium]|nr:trypsin-like peptidase domain-containing protein [Planctomycetaceae bacterium]